MIYRKGDDQMGLQKRALEQSIDEMSSTRGMSAEGRFDRDVKSGVQGARNVVNLNPTVKEATDNPTTMGGPVSGAALAKFKAKKSDSKATKEKEMKRR